MERDPAAGVAVPRDPAELRRVYGCFPSGVTALCGTRAGAPVGMAASSFTSVSIDPPLVSVCVQNTSTTWPVLRGPGRIGVSVLGKRHERECRALSARAGDRFVGVGWIASEGGAVFIRDAPAWLDCALSAEVPAGDHAIVLLRVIALWGEPEGEPLVFHGSRFRQLAALPTGG